MVSVKKKSLTYGKDSRSPMKLRHNEVHIPGAKSENGSFYLLRKQNLDIETRSLNTNMFQKLKYQKTF